MKNSTRKLIEAGFATFANVPMAMLGGLGMRALIDKATTLKGKFGATLVGFGALGSMIWLQNKGIQKAIEDYFEAEEDEESYSHIDFDKVHGVES